jgi:hypothetical protein
MGLFFAPPEILAKSAVELRERPVFDLPCSHVSRWTDVMDTPSRPSIPGHLPAAHGPVGRTVHARSRRFGAELARQVAYARPYALGRPAGDPEPGRPARRRSARHTRRNCRHRRQRLAAHAIARGPAILRISRPRRCEYVALVPSDPGGHVPQSSVRSRHRRRQCRS